MTNRQASDQKNQQRPNQSVHISSKAQALHAWCREKGLFEHQLRQWHQEFCQTGKTAAIPVDNALRQAKQKNEQPERELPRKDKALAEAAALLVLQKKSQALWDVLMYVNLQGF